MSSLWIFAHQDLDGVVAAGLYARWDYLTNEGGRIYVNFFSYQNIDRLPLAVHNALVKKNFDRVVILDLSLDTLQVAQLEALAQYGDIKVIDHHSTGIKHLANTFLPCCLREDMCTAEIVASTNDEFQKDLQIKPWVDIAVVRDFGQLNEHTETAQKLNILSKYRSYDLYKAVYQGDSIVQVLYSLRQWERGLYYIERSKTWAKLTETLFEAAGISCVLAFVVSNTQDVALTYKAEGYDFIALVVVSPEKLPLSLRCELEWLDVSIICENYGGGGHKNAAGAVYDISEKAKLADLATNLVSELTVQIERQR